MQDVAAFLLIVRQGDRHEVHPFCQRQVSIGRSRQNDLTLQDRLVSRSHCRVEQQEDGFLLVDQGGQNPVMLRGMPVERCELRIGDTFSIGDCEITLALPDRDLPSSDETSSGEGRGSAGDMATLIGIARALNEEQDLTRLLTSIVDAAIELTRAERGFLILGQADEPTVEVARNFAQEEVLSPEFKISRTIAQRVRETGVPELTTNAQEDARFRDLRSVADLRLRSVLCIPIRIRGEGVGILYVDNRLQQQVFKEREKALLMSLADHAGIAIHNARTMEQLRAKQSELHLALDRVARLNAALKGKLEEKQAELSEIRGELDTTSAERRYRHDYSQIIGDSPGMRQIFELLDKYIDADEPVLILGESGTGKELIARAVHAQSARRDKPFISENVAAMPESLLESELFGHAKGAFTGATRDKKGLLEAANGGVLFLDEIGDMPSDLQAKLLRVLQEGEVRPVGGNRMVKVDVRLVTATNRNLEEMVREGEFREDLYYRLNVLPVVLPPLRERRGDIPALVARLLMTIARESSQARIRVSPDAMEALLAYDWPGNVRELHNEIRRSAILCDGVILREHLGQRVREPGLRSGQPTLVPAESGTTLPELVRDLEVRLISECLRRAGGNKSRTSQMLGLSRFALQRKLEKYGIGGTAPATGEQEESPA